MRNGKSTRMISVYFDSPNTSSPAPKRVFGDFTKYHHRIWQEGNSWTRFGLPDDQEDRIRSVKAISGLLCTVEAELIDCPIKLPAVI